MDTSDVYTYSPKKEENMHLRKRVGWGIRPRSSQHLDLLDDSDITEMVESSAKELPGLNENNVSKKDHLKYRYVDDKVG